MGCTRSLATGDTTGTMLIAGVGVAVEVQEEVGVVVGVVGAVVERQTLGTSIQLRRLSSRDSGLSTG